MKDSFNVNKSQASAELFIYGKNINLEEIATMRVILPPLAKQIEIAAHISNLRQQAKQLYLEGNQFVEIAKLEIEQMILGE